MEVLHHLRAQRRRLVITRTVARPLVLLVIPLVVPHVKARGLVLAALALGLATAGCGGDRPPGETADTAALLSAEMAAARADSGRADTSASAGGDVIPTEEADSASQPVFVMASDSAAGEALYHGRGTCLTCHGSRGAGVPNLGPDLRDSIWLHGGSLQAIARVIENGIAVPKAGPAPMPAFAGRLTPEEIGQVAAYVYALSHPGSVLTHDFGAPVLDPRP